MKKFFLIAGLIAGIGATNGYADIVISQPDDNSDMIVTVARATKEQTRVTPKTNNSTVKPNNEELLEELKSDIAQIQCPTGCKLKCKKRQNEIRCICKDEFGRPCDVLVNDNERQKVKHPVTGIELTTVP